MKKENACKFLYAVSAFLVLGFVIRFGVDLYRYNEYAGSAPVYVYAIERFAEFIVPSVILLIVAIVIGKSSQTKRK